MLYAWFTSIRFRVVAFAQAQQRIRLYVLLYLLETQGEGPCTFSKNMAAGKSHYTAQFPLQETVLWFPVCGVAVG